MSFCLGPPGRNGFSQRRGWFPRQRTPRLPVPLPALCPSFPGFHSWYLPPCEQSLCKDHSRLREVFYPGEPDMMVKKGGVAGS